MNRMPREPLRCLHDVSTGFGAPRADVSTLRLVLIRENIVYSFLCDSLFVLAEENMKKLMLVLVLVFCTTARADNLTDIDADTIKAAGIPVYFSAVFATGNKDVGFRFATADAPDKVKQWYREQLANWSFFDSYGAWIIYDGKP
jgi:hypothetical protein